ncbi:hypothetical protein Dsin_000058 [Dipteronia sinensis]|uniref:RNase H type-1 domain-containing protein n=1 Tax=Dipteronia sinensis TaxID=43782 RepID=A0AAD9YZV7_9ROSI|nr:hypothetical protein Dsin_000058 [Dipteronia sinensis]
MAFNGKNQVVEQCMDLVKFRVAWWFKHHGKGSSEHLTSIMFDISARCINTIKIKKTKLKDWMPPSFDSLKFNVDGSAKGAPGLAGMGGVLMYSNRKILCIFSSFLGVKDANSAEIEAIHRACSLCVSNDDLRDRAVSWVNEGDFGSLKHINLIYDIRNILHYLSNTVVLYNSRATNSFADLLAKKGSSRNGDFIQWGDVEGGLPCSVSWFLCRSPLWVFCTDSWLHCADCGVLFFSLLSYEARFLLIVLFYSASQASCCGLA